MWNKKSMITLVIIGATETNGLMKNMEAISGKYSIDSLQETAILGTSHIMDSIAVWNLKVGITVGSREAWGKKEPVTTEKKNNNSNNQADQKCIM